MGELFNLPLEVWGGVIALLFLLMFLILLFMGMKIRNISQKHKKMLESEGAANLENIILKLQEEASTANRVQASQQQAIMSMQQAMRRMKANVEIHRYHAFENGMGQSFSIAILDEEKNGVILTGIHNRDETYLYAKPIENGVSEHALSPEEKQVIDQVVLKTTK